MEINLSPGSLLTPRIYIFEIFQKCPIFESFWKLKHTVCTMSPKTLTCEHCMCSDTCHMCTCGVRVHLTSLTLILIITTGCQQAEPGGCKSPSASDQWLFRKKMHLVLVTHFNSKQNEVIAPVSSVWCATQSARAFIIYFILFCYFSLKNSCSFKGGNAQLRTYLQVYQSYAGAPVFIMLRVSDLFHSIFHERYI